MEIIGRKGVIMDLGFLEWALDNLGGTLLVIVLGAMVFNRFLRHLDERSEMDRQRQMSWDSIRKSDSEGWMGMIASQKIAIEGMNMTVGALHETIKADRLAGMAYQNTSSTALVDLLKVSKELRGVPAGVKSANDALVNMGKAQRISIEEDARADLEHKKDMAKINNALAEMQREIKKMAGAMERLPNDMQATLAPLVGMMNVVISTAQATQARLDDLPLLDRVVENVLSTPTADTATEDVQKHVPTDIEGML